MDNIQLRSGQKLSFSYQATYTQETALTKISVQDRDLLKQGKSKDGYVDIGIQSSDTCQKGERILFNENTRSHRTYEEIFNDIQAVIDSYTSGAQMVQTQKINSILDQIQNISNIQEVTQVQ
jgi:hypothetical protein